MRGISEERLRELISCVPDAAKHYKEFLILNQLAGMCTEINPWIPIETAPKNKSIMLCCGVAQYGTQLIYCGRYRSGTMGEPQAHEIAWRCDSSGRFSHPTHWMPLPEPPK